LPIKGFHSSNQPSAEKQAVIQERLNHLEGKLRRLWSNARSENIQNEGGEAQLSDLVRSAANAFGDVQPTGRDDDARKIDSRRRGSKVSLERLATIAIAYRFAHDRLVSGVSAE
jgi:hypothetical protein